MNQVNEEPRKTAKVSSSTGISYSVTEFARLSKMKNAMVSRIVKDLACKRGIAAHCLNWETIVFMGNSGDHNSRSQY